MKKRVGIQLTTAVAAALACGIASAQFGGGGGGPKGGGKAAPSNLPSQPTAVALPTLSAKITGPGLMYDSAPAVWPGRDTKYYSYESNEYFVSGTANGKPYMTRLVIRKPADNAKFSGLVIAESMHPAGNAHGFEFTQVYTMSSGHIAAEILTSGPSTMLAVNKERYEKLQMSGDQTNEILAQVGSLVRDAKGPLAGLTVRKMILFGTSASSFTLTNYLPAHMVYRTPGMQHVYDGFMPTSNGTVIQAVDVPVIQMPTQHEYGAVATARQDGDEPKDQYRNYEFAGLGHLDARNNPRFSDKDCVNPRSAFPTEAYFSVALHHLFQWVDKGIKPPHADRVLLDRNTKNDGSLMVLDDNGNPKGGIRNPYVDFAVVKYTERNPASPTAQGQTGLLCSLSVYTTAIPQPKLKQMYKNKNNYVKQFEARLTELEKAGWSLPVYHDLLMADARKVEF